MHNTSKKNADTAYFNLQNLKFSHFSAELERVFVQKLIHWPVGRRWWIYVSTLITALSVFYSDISLKIEIAIS